MSGTWKHVWNVLAWVLTCLLALPTARKVSSSACFLVIRERYLDATC